jgi:DNA repair protein RecO (recombination protein O)
VLAKGGRRLKSSFEVALDLLSVCSICVLRKSSGGLDLLTEAVLQERFDGFRTDLSALYAGYYVAELVDGLTETDDAHPALYDATIEVLRQLAGGKDRKLTLVRYQLRLLREVGYAPSLETCVGCGEQVRLSKKTQYSVPAGGLLCAECARASGNVVTVQGASIQIMKRLLADTPDALKGLAVGSVSLQELWQITSRSILHALGRPPKMASLLQL